MFQSSFMGFRLPLHFKRGGLYPVEHNSDDAGSEVRPKRWVEIFEKLSCLPRRAFSPGVGTPALSLQERGSAETLVKSAQSAMSFTSNSTFVLPLNSLERRLDREIDRTTPLLEPFDFPAEAEGDAFHRSARPGG